MSAEKVLDSKVLYEGRVVTLALQTVELPNGRTSSREIIRHRGAVAILPLHEDGQITLIRQYRLAAGDTLWEIPAGTLEPGEDPRDCAIRELQEEAGLRPGNLVRLGGVFPAPGYSSEYIHLFVATDLTPSVLQGDDDESIETVVVPLDEALAMVSRGEIENAMAVIALLWVSRWLG